ncbi:NAD(P)-binding domain-containing protein [Embleya sp. NBC_00896]|uniref:NADPH-dependent F420 reductase n=1 Tax=Embleya sp. NBC_00896 TaxID=2975961 RepID=UPI002F915F06|nr:NAD(P)-binding domain-containing protein [Embleya sp. NBC_00896]
MTTLGLIGSGMIGGTLARLAVAAGIDVVLSNSRGPQTLAPLVAELGPRARAATPAEAAAAGDWVVVSIPLGHQREVPADAVVGKVVLDTTNYYPQRDGHVAALDTEETTTSELLQAHLPAAAVVKVFNNIYFKHLAALARPAGAPDRTALPIAGDDADAKAATTRLLDLLGYDAVDAGDLAEGWRYQRDTAAYATLYTGNPQSRSLSADDPGRSVGADELRAALAAARRYKETPA